MTALVTRRCSGGHDGNTTEPAIATATAIRNFEIRDNVRRPLCLPGQIALVMPRVSWPRRGTCAPHARWQPRAALLASLQLDDRHHLDQADELRRPDDDV